MFDQKKKHFYCNNCQKEIQTGEKVWTKWNFPPDIHATQLKSRKELEFENAAILCMDCASTIMKKEF